MRGRARQKSQAQGLREREGGCRLEGVSVCVGAGVCAGRERERGCRWEGVSMHCAARRTRERRDGARKAVD